jgi:soluble lytic murein transglycosylase-like protein
MELYTWVLGEAPAVRFRALSEKPVSKAIDTHRRSFELFRRYSDGGERRDYVEGLPFGSTIAAVAERFALDPLLVVAVIEAESGYDWRAISPMGSVGLMQVMPETAAQYGAQDAYDPIVNIGLGCRHLAGLMERFEGDMKLALAGYNAGPGAVDRFDGVPPYRETRRYVDRVLGSYVEHHRELWRQSSAHGWLF